LVEGAALQKVEARKEEIKERNKRDRLHQENLPSDEIMLQEAKRVGIYYVKL
jgi:hypothetical protein